MTASDRPDPAEPTPHPTGMDSSDESPTLPTQRQGSTDDAPPPPDRMIGHYRLLQSLGRGAQGHVFLAEDTRLSRKVALKILSTAFASSRSELARFKREAAAASKLDHPSICAIYEAGEADGIPYIAMRYVEGESLASHISTARSGIQTEDGTLILGSSSATSAGAPPERPAQETDNPPSARHPSSRNEINSIVSLVEQAARGLHVAHEAGLIHRDIKPGNIMLTRSGTPVILDFGLARDEESDVPSLTVSGDLLGTPAYMSPEQLLAQRIQLDRRTDVYSLGVTLYECLTLKRPFDAPTRDALYQQILASTAPDPCKVNAHIPRDLKVIVETAIEKDRNRRYQTALDFAEDLRRFRCFEPIHARPAGPILRFNRWVQRNPVIATATLGLFLVLVTGLAISLTLLKQVHDAKTQTEKALDAKDSALASLERESAAKTAALDEREQAIADWKRALEAAQRERDEKTALYTTARGAAVLADNPGQALLLGLEGTDRHLNQLTRNLLVAALRELREERTLLGHEGSVGLALFSPDGAHVLTTSADGQDITARLHDVETGALRGVFRGHRSPIAAASFSADGARIVTAGGDGVAIVWEAATGRRVSTFSGHLSSVLIHGAVFNPDGTRVLTTSEDGTSQIWDVETGRRLVPPLRGHDCFHASACFSADGRYVLTTSSSWIKTFTFDDRGFLNSTYWRPKSGGTTARIWDAASGEQLQTLGGHGGRVDGCFTADGEQIVTASNERLRAWKLNGEEHPYPDDSGASPPVMEALFRMSQHSRKEGPGAYFSPDGRLVAISDSRGALVVRRTGDGATVRQLALGAEGALLAAFSPDASQILVVAANQERLATVRDLETGRVLHTLRGHESRITSATFSPDGNRVATSSSDGTARVWNLRWSFGSTVPVDPGALAFRARPPVLSPDGSRLLVRGVTLLDTTTGSTVKELEPPFRLNLIEKASMDLAVFSADGKSVVTAPRNGPTLIWDTESGAETTSPRLTRQLVPVVVSPDGRLTVELTGGSNTLRVVPFADPNDAFTLEGHGGSVQRLAFDATGRRMLSTAQDRSLRVWDLETRRALLEKRTDLDPIEVARLSADGRHAVLLSIGNSMLVEVWAIDDASPIALFTPPGRLVDVLISPTDAWLLLLGAEGEAMLRPAVVSEGEVSLLDAEKRFGGITAGTFAPDGTRVVTIHEDDAIRIWQRTGEGARLQATLAGHTDIVSAASFSPDGRRVASSSLDGTARVWDAISGRELRTLRRHTGPVLGVSWHPDSERIVTASEDRSAVIWDAGSGKSLHVLEKRGFAFNVLNRGRPTQWYSEDAPDIFTPTGDRLLTREENRLTMWDGRTGAAINSIERSSGATTMVAVPSDDGRLVAVFAGQPYQHTSLAYLMQRQGRAALADLDRPTIEIWDMESGERVSRPRVVSENGRSLVFSPDGSRIAAANVGGEIHIFDVATGAAVANPGSQRGTISMLRFSPDGSSLIAVYKSAFVTIFDASTGVARPLARTQYGNLIDVDLSPDGALLVTAEGDRVAQLWSLEEGVNVATLGGHFDNLTAVAFSRDGRHLLSASETEVKVWDVASRAELVTFPRLSGIAGASFNAAGDEVVVAHDDGVTRWPLEVVSIARARKPRDLTPDEFRLHEIGTPSEQEIYRLTFRLERTLAEELRLVRAASLSDDSVANLIETTLRDVVNALADDPSERSTRGALAVAQWVASELGLGHRGGVHAVLGDLHSLLGERREAILEYERALGDTDGTAGFEAKLAALRQALWPDLASYASVDAALSERRVLVPAGATWRFFRGRRDPSPELEWTSVDFDDSSWESGPTGIGYGDDDDATVLTDMRNAYTTVYMRHAFDVEDESEFASATFDIRVDDGFVAFLNGVEFGRVRAGPSGMRLYFDHEATATVTNAVPEQVALPTNLLRRGQNVLALHILNASPSSTDLSAIPELSAELLPSTVRDRVRFADFLSRTSAPQLADYLVSRLLEREGRLEDAIARLQPLVEAETTFAEPLVALTRLLASVGRPEDAVAALAAGLRRGLTGDPRVAHQWYELAVVKARLTPKGALAALPPGLDDVAAHRTARDLAWSLDQLAKAAALRINCGGSLFVDRSGATWSRDRCFRGGTSVNGQSGVESPGVAEIAGTDDDLLYMTQRWYGVGRAETGGYSIPAPPGTYRVTLHFAEVVFDRSRARRFEIRVEGQSSPALTGYEPYAAGFATADRLSFEVDVKDGWLDIDFLSGASYPIIAAIEIEAK